MRRKTHPIDAERLLASIVLPTPGTSSTKRWPWAISAASARSTTGVLPTMTLETLSTMARAAAAGEPLCSTSTSGR